MPELSDYQALIARRDVEQQKARHIHDQRVILPRIAEIAYKSQTVLDHPGWQLFADKLETRIQEIQAARDATAQRMVTGTEMGHDLELLKINLNAMYAEIAGLKFAAGLIPQAVAYGRAIATGANGSAAETSNAGLRA